jgi:predicted phosphoribosyltransferase
MGTVRILSHNSEPFEGREQAGEQLALQLGTFDGRKPVVLGIPRGGVIVAHEIAVRLKADLDVILAHKLGAPHNPELAVGAVLEDGTHFVNKLTASYAGADNRYIQREKAIQHERLAQRAQQYRQVRPRLSLRGRVVIVTDDGAATGASMQAALWTIRMQSPERIVLALPVSPEDTIRMLSESADETVCLKAPPDFQALSRFYLRFEQVSDEQVLNILEQETLRRSER